MITIKEAEKLNTQRLLTYYKKYGNKWSNKYICGCCGEFYWNIGYNSNKKDYDEEKLYWSKIKEILNTREHVESKIKG